MREKIVAALESGEQAGPDGQGQPLDGSRGARTEIERVVERRTRAYTLQSVATTLVADPLAPFSPAVRAWFEASFEAPTQAQAEGWAAIARGEHTLIHAPTGSGKTLAAFLYTLDRLAQHPSPPPPEGPARQRPRPVHLAAQGPDLRRRAQPARPAHRHRPRGTAPRRGAAADHRRQPDGRHPLGGPARDRAPRPGHPDHDPREPVPHADQPGARDPPRRRARHRRRGPRDRRHETGCPPRPEPGTARSAPSRGRGAAAAHRAVAPRSGRSTRSPASSAASGRTARSPSSMPAPASRSSCRSSSRSTT